MKLTIKLTIRLQSIDETLTKKKKGINQLVAIIKVCLICCYSIITSEALIIVGYGGLPDYLETLC